MCRSDIAPEVRAQLGAVLAEMAAKLAAESGVPASDVQIGPVDFGPEEDTNVSASETGLTSYAELAGLLRNLRMLIREKRRRLDLSQRDVATQTGISPSTICRYDAGQDVSLANAILLVDWLGQP